MMLSGKVIVVAGAGGNLGMAVAATLMERGALLVLADRSGRSAERETESTLLATGLDLSDPAGSDRLIGRALQRFGRIDGLVNTVGAFAAAPLAESGPDLWDSMMRANLFTTLSLFRAAIPPMRAQRGGSLVAVGAGAALHAPAGFAAYAASKSAVLRLVESAADELRPDGVRANAVLPGTMDTPQNRAAMPGADVSRWVTPAQVAAAIAFLLSDEASGVTGASIPVAR